jgi:putative ABC transport system permease protein
MRRGMFSPPVRGWTVIAVIALNVAAMWLYATLSVGLSVSLVRERQLLGADLLIVPRGARITPNEALFVGTPTKRRLPESTLSVLRQMPEITRFTPQLYLRTLRLGCCSLQSMPVVGFDPRTDFILRPFLGNVVSRIGEHDLVAGCVAADSAPSGKLLIYGEPFHVRGVLPCTGMGVDKTLFISIDVARRIAPATMHVGPGDISGMLVRLKDPRNAVYVSETIEYAIDGSQVLKVSGLVRGVSDRVRLLQRLLGLALAAFCAASIVLLVGLGRLSVETRRRDIALFRALGATRGDVFELMIGETLMLGAVASALGVFAGAVVFLLPAVRWMRTFHAPVVMPSLIVVIGLAGLIAVVAVGAAVVAGLPSVLRCCHIEPDAALREAM